MKNYSAIAFVPARQGSKRFPGKNKRLLGGKPLFLHSVEAAIDSGCYQKVVISTDDEEIIELCRDMEEITVFKRPAEYAGDDVRAKDVVLYHLRVMKEQFDYVSLLMPTSPFRDAQDIEKSFQNLIREDADSIVSVARFAFHPALALRISNGRLGPYFDRTREVQWVRDDSFEAAYHLNGAIFTAKTGFFLSTESFLHNGALTYIMSASKSVDIDTEEDLRYAKFLAGGSSK